MRLCVPFFWNQTGLVGRETSRAGHFQLFECDTEGPPGRRHHHDGRGVLQVGRLAQRQR